MKVFFLSTAKENEHQVELAAAMAHWGHHVKSYLVRLTPCVSGHSFTILLAHSRCSSNFLILFTPAHGQAYFCFDRSSHR